MMTVHKLTAGNGYTYLIRQVATADEARTRGQALADYYAARGNPPGVWIGGGARALHLQGGVVSEQQMQALFAEGRHPDRDHLLAGGADEGRTRLGAPFRGPSTGDGSAHRQTIAGYDLVFTPVKSASVLWALGGPRIRTLVEEAHHAAVTSSVQWLEQHAAFTRTGHAGIEQIDTTGFLAVAFDHRDSRAGDPDLHTHVAVANKVQGVDGRWRSMDGRVLHAAGVAASERYNTRLEDELHRRLGVRFAERAHSPDRKRPVREIRGVPSDLLLHFSKRRIAIEDRYADLLRDYRDAHGREPGRATQLRLAQQATLETRQGKKVGRTLAEQVAGWTAEAVGVVGRQQVERLARDTVAREVTASTLDREALVEVARAVVTRVSDERSTWTRWNIYAEAERVLRPLRFSSAEDRDRATETVVSVATSPTCSIRIDEPDLATEPTELRRASDRESVYRVHGGERYTTSAILRAEDDLVRAALTHADAIDPLVAEAALAVHEYEDAVSLDAGQRTLVSYFVTFPSRLALGIGPAGAGKTTAMRAFAAVLAADGRRIVPLASSAKAAQVLALELDTRAENLHKFLHEQTRGTNDPWFRLGAGDVVLVDEAGLAGTGQLARIVDLASSAGALVRLLGDPAQLTAVEAGGALRLLESEVGAARLDQLHRFHDRAEAEATIRLRDGDASALDFYLSRGRVAQGSKQAMLDAAYRAWATDIRAGLTSILLASGDDVRALNARARTERIEQGLVDRCGVLLRDDNTASRGDWIVTRANARALTCHRGREWVRNGDRWTVVKQHPDGSLTGRHLEHRGRVRLPASYVEGSVELAYATTAHRAQGATVDTSHALITDETTRESLYVASTRGRQRNHWYAVTDELIAAATDRTPREPLTTRELMTGVLGRTGAEQAARTVIRDALRDASSLPVLVGRYRDAWSRAAMAALFSAVDSALEPETAQRVIRDPARRRLAETLAAAAAQGTDPTWALRAAAAYADLDGARSPALVLASRLDELPQTLGITGESRPRPPLPWLPAPVVGHAEWDAYLAARARLISDRYADIGSLTAAYREQYGLEHLPPNDLGDEPDVVTGRREAFRHAQQEQMRLSAQNGRPRQAVAPVPPRARARGRQLTL